MTLTRWVDLDLTWFWFWYLDSKRSAIVTPSYLDSDFEFATVSTKELWSHLLLDAIILLPFDSSTFLDRFQPLLSTQAGQRA
jgi:hypothetical protein